MDPLPGRLGELYIKSGLDYEFFRYLFPRDKDSGVHRIAGTGIVAGFIRAHARDADTRVGLEPKSGMELCRVLLPTEELFSRDGWVVFREQDMRLIWTILESCFELDFYRYFLKGMQYGYEKKETVEAYVISRNLVTGEPFDTLHKRVYRNEMKLMEMKVRQLTRKARYFFSEADDTLLQPKI